MSKNKKQKKQSKGFPMRVVLVSTAIIIILLALILPNILGMFGITLWT